MFKKKYGKMTVNAWLVSEMEATRPWVMLLGGILLTAGGILVRLFCGSPYRRMLELGIAELTPPVWLMTLLWTVAFFTVGCAGGFVLGYRVAGCDGEKYKGCMLFVLFAIATEPAMRYLGRLFDILELKIEEMTDRYRRGGQEDEYSFEE